MINRSKIPITLKGKLEKNPLVLGLVLVGSFARKDIYRATPYSDMEIYIIVKNGDVKKIEKQLPSLVKSLGKVIFSYPNQWAGFSTVFEDLFRLELPITRLSELGSVFSRPTAQTVKVLIDKTEGKLEKALANRPKSIDYQELFQKKVTDFWYMAIIAVQYYKKKEIWNCRSALQVLQSSLIKFLELLQDPKTLLLETNKNVEEFLSDEQIDLLKKISPAYNKAEIKKALKKAIETFPQVFEKVAEKRHYQYNKELEKKIKPKLIALLES
jgi:predicted nucleotidyltransferase